MINLRKVIFFSTLTLICLLIAIFFYSKKNSSKQVLSNVEYIHNQGNTQGTNYTATYLQPEGRDLQQKIEKQLHLFDLSLSTYDSTSIISRINRNDPTVKVDSVFEHMFYVAKQVSEHTNGAFDITVGPLVKAWGFGFGNADHSQTPDLKKLLPLIGYNKVSIEKGKFVKQLPNILIDANALAQGYSTDIIGKLLEDNGCKNYMIEIGGEIVCKGLNPKGGKWRIGIDKPIDDLANTKNEIQTVVAISNIAITTSGNYRKFYIKDGKKYAHTINPHTGYPVVHNLLSATVAAPTCIMADAYATAFMVLGVDSAMKICKSVPNMDCYLIYSDVNGENKVIYTDGFKKYIIE